MSTALNSHSEELRCAAEAFFADVAANTPARHILSHFSTTAPIAFAHAPAHLQHTFPIAGLNAVRSYFDLIATHFTRKAMTKHEQHIDPEHARVVVRASIQWQWKRSGRSWTEDFILTLDYDDNLKVTSFVISTESDDSTCVMWAVDT